MLKKFKNNFNLWNENDKPQSVNIKQVPTLKDVMGTGNKYFKDINHMSK